MKILISDDRALFRDNMARYITQKHDDVVVLQVSDFSQALRLIDREQNVDLVILNIDNLRETAFESIEKLRHASESVKIAIISSLEDLAQIKKLIKAGVTGYIPRQINLNTMHEAVDLLVSGKSYIPKALQDLKTENNFKTGVKTLTTRQSEVLELIAQGKSNKQIAYEMNVSEATVKLHINALLRTLKVTNRTQAVVTAQKIGLI